MTIDIIEAAKADRQTKLDQILALQLDVIEIDAFIARARSYAGDGETNTTAPKPLPEDQGDSATESIAPEHRPAEAKTVDQEPLSNGSGGVQDGLPAHPANPIPSTPQPQEGEETGAVAEPAPVKRATKYERVLEALRENPKANARALATISGCRISTAKVYLLKARAEIEDERVSEPPAEPVKARKPAPAPVAAKKPEPRPTLPNEPIRTVHTVARQQPKGTMFRLRNADGLFLHCDLNAMIRNGLRFVGKHEYPWEGSERQLLAVRKMLPATIDLREEVITNG